jgi:hypothetical protein
VKAKKTQRIAQFAETLNFASLPTPFDLINKSLTNDPVIKDVLKIRRVFTVSTET